MFYKEEMHFLLIVFFLVQYSQTDVDEFRPLHRSNRSSVVLQN